MSIRIAHTVEIARPASACWELFAEVAGWPRWFPMLEAVERPTVGALRAGEVFTLRLAFRGHGVAVPVKVEALAPGRSVRWIGRNLGVTGDHAFHVEALTEGRTRFTSEERFSGLPVRLLPRVLFRALEEETVAGLARFRALAETG